MAIERLARVATPEDRGASLAILRHINGTQQVLKELIVARAVRAMSSS